MSANAGPNGRRPLLVVDLVTPEKTSPSRRRQRAVISQPLQQQILRLEQGLFRIQQELPLVIEKARNRRINGPSNQKNNKVTKESTPQQPKPKQPSQQQPTSDGGRIALCPICFECVFKEKAASTDCGHLFCHQCILQEIEIRPRCPMCSRKLTKSQIIPIYGHH